MATRIREKAEKIKQTRDKRPFAKAKYVRITPSKVSVVLDLIRGKDLADAETILSLKTNSSAMPCLKVLKSAAANAENNLKLNRDELYVAECYSGAGPTLRRTNIRGRGRADLMLKRTSHITIILDVKPDAFKSAEPKKEVKKATVAKPAAPKATTEKPVAVKTVAKSTTTKTTTAAPKVAVEKKAEVK